jgi:ligand-binding sensor domain-containing protein
MNPLEKWRTDSAPKAKRLNILWCLVFFLLLVLCAESAVWAVDPSRHVSQYAHTAWRIQDGVLGGTPFAIAQTTDGYLWR